MNIVQKLMHLNEMLHSSPACSKVLKGLCRSMGAGIIKLGAFGCLYTPNTYQGTLSTSIKMVTIHAHMVIEFEPGPPP